VQRGSVGNIGKINNSNKLKSTIRRMEAVAGRSRVGRMNPSEPARDQALTVGVMGSADPHVPESARAVLTALGRTVAERGCVLITGACPGLPQVAVEAAKAAGGTVVGISPALSRDEHIHGYGSPTAGFDVIVYNGSGLMGREVDTIRSSDIVIIAGGRSGTLGEFSIAYDEGHLIGVLTGTGGIADHVEKILEVISVKDTGARVLSDDDPVALVDRLIAEQHRRLQERRPQRQPMRSEPAPG
jgi:uncharacterized protein (TIGR00725 family)